MRVAHDDGSGAYKCDWCKRNLSVESYPHITLGIGRRSGIAHPVVKPWVGWRIVLVFQPRRVHFCLPSGEGQSCLDQWARAVADAGAGAAEYLR